MAYPTIAVRIAFTTDPLDDTPSWTTIPAALVKAISTRRGRSNELSQFDAGTATVLFDNADGRFSPNETSGPYYPNIKPALKVNIRASHGGTDYDLFTGFVETWRPRHQGPMPTDEVEVGLVDGFKLLNLKLLNAAYGQQLSGDRVDQVLSTVGWPAADRLVAAGQAEIQASTLVDTSGLTHILTVQQSEVGVFYIDGAGNAVWQDRVTRYAAPYITSQMTFADNPGGGEFPYQEVEFSYDDANLYNEVRLTRTGGTQQVITDATSITEYGPRTLKRDGLLAINDPTVNDMAQYLNFRYKDPHLRVEAIRYVYGGDDTIWPELLDREISDRVTVQLSYADYDEDSYIERVEHEIEVGLRWETVFGLSPVIASQDISTRWLLEVAGQTELEQTTVLGW